MNKMKQYYLMRLIVTTLFGIGIGVALLLLEPYATEIFDILIIAMGLLTAVMNLPAVLFALQHISRRGEWVNLTVALFSVLLGVALMLLQSDLLLLLLGIYSVVLPVIRIALVEDHLKRLKREVPRFFTGLIMVIIFLTESEGYVLRFGAIAAFVLSLIYLVYGLIFMYFTFSEYAARIETEAPEGTEEQGENDE